MSKPANVDIHNLFRKFGGDAGSYREIVRDQTEEKALNWPIIAAMNNELTHAPRISQPAPIEKPVPRASTSLFDAIQSNLGTGASGITAQTQAPASGTLNSLFHSLEAENIPAQPPQTVAVPPAETASPKSSDELTAVFSRLLAPERTEEKSPPQSVLQNIFSRLHK